MSTPPAGWSKLKGDDQLNQWGYKPYHTVFEKTMGGKGGVPRYDLSVLLHDDGHYLAAHGGIVMKEKYSTALKAADAALAWYYQHAQQTPTKESMMTKALQFLEKFGEDWYSSSNSTVSEPIRKWVSYVFKDMELPAESIKAKGNRLMVYTKKFNLKKFKRLMMDYAGEEGENYKGALELMSKENLKSTKPKNVWLDLDTLYSHVEPVGDNLIQGVVSFELREM